MPPPETIFSRGRLLSAWRNVRRFTQVPGSGTIVLLLERTSIDQHY